MKYLAVMVISVLGLLELIIKSVPVILTLGVMLMILEDNFLESRLFDLAEKVLNG